MLIYNILQNMAFQIVTELNLDQTWVYQEFQRTYINLNKTLLRKVISEKLATCRFYLRACFSTQVKPSYYWAS